jgi:hypothetical protein
MIMTQMAFPPLQAIRSYLFKNLCITTVHMITVSTLFTILINLALKLGVFSICYVSDNISFIYIRYQLGSHL